VRAMRHTGLSQSLDTRNHTPRACCPPFVWPTSHPVFFPYPVPTLLPISNPPNLKPLLPIVSLHRIPTPSSPHSLHDRLLLSHRRRNLSSCHSANVADSRSCNADKQPNVIYSSDHPLFPSSRPPPHLQRTRLAENFIFLTVLSIPF
jgi:hypothetical protein